MIMHQQSKVFRWNVLFAGLIFGLLIWLTSGTLAPYAVSAGSHITQPNGCPYNGDHPHFYGSYLLLDGAPQSTWEFSVVLRRLLYPILAYPWMKILGFEMGGFIFNLILHGVVFFEFVNFLKKVAGEKSALLVMWLLATYPGTFYWSGMPYSHAAIIPVSLLLTILLWKLTQAIDSKSLLSLLIGIGILLTAYDLFPFFGLGALLILVSRRMWKWLPIAIVLILLPQSAILFWLEKIKNSAPINSNTTTYLEIVRAWLHPSDFHQWFRLIIKAPRFLWLNFLRSNYLYLPFYLLICVVVFRKERIWKIHLCEKVVLLAGLAVFLFNNLAPPYTWQWQLRGEFIPRIYQPLIAIYLLMIARMFSELPQLKSNLRILIYAGFAFTLLNQIWIDLCPYFGRPLAASINHHHFYQHAGEYDYAQWISKLGTKPIGFCQ